MRGQGEDKMCWKLASQKGFEVSSYHRALALGGAVKFHGKVGKA